MVAIAWGIVDIQSKKRRSVGNVDIQAYKRRRSDENHGFIANENCGLIADDDRNYGDSVTESNGDSFNRLPFDVVTFILSCLPTIYAVQTSILARDWRNKWTYVDSIALDDNGKLRGRTDKLKLRGRFRINNFITLVNKVLGSTQDLTLRSFRISCKTYDAKLIEAWIFAVLVRKVQYLVIEAKARGTVVLPLGISGWNSLTKVKLSSTCTLNILREKICFPKLKSLYLSGRKGHGIITIDNNVPDKERVLFIFPVLEELVLKDCRWLNVKYVEIRAPELIRFRADCRFNHCEIKICAVKLETFESEGRIDNFDLSNASCVNDVTLCHRLDTEVEKSRVLKILNGIPKLKRLKLSCGMIKDFVDHRVVLPTFIHVKHFELFYWGMYNPEDMLKFLHLLPSLRYLRLSLAYNNEFVYSKKRNLPPCFASHLKEAQFTNFHQGQCDHIDTVNFFLEYAKNLQRVYISVDRRQPGMKNAETRDMLLPLLHEISSCRIDVAVHGWARLGVKA